MLHAHSYSREYFDAEILKVYLSTVGVSFPFLVLQILPKLSVVEDFPEVEIKQTWGRKLDVARMHIHPF